MAKFKLVLPVQWLLVNCTLGKLGWVQPVVLQTLEIWSYGMETIRKMMEFPGRGLEVMKNIGDIVNPNSAYCSSSNHFMIMHLVSKYVPNIGFENRLMFGNFCAHFLIFSFSFWVQTISAISEISLRLLYRRHISQWNVLMECQFRIV